MISGFLPVRRMFIPWFLLPPWTFRERGGHVLTGRKFSGPVSLAYSADVFPGYSCWCCRLGQ